MNTVTKSYTVNSILYMMAMSHNDFNKLCIAVSNYCSIFSLTFFKIKYTTKNYFIKSFKTICKYFKIWLKISVYFDPTACECAQ